MGIVSISDKVRCLRIGFLAPGGRRTTGRSIPSRSSVVAVLGGGTASTLAVTNGPYNHVTSESFSLDMNFELNNSSESTPSHHP